jgi:hypothetical protein
MKKIVKKELDKLISEASISGEKVTKKAQNTSKGQNNSYYKDTEKKMGDYDKNLKQDDEDSIDAKKYNTNDDEKEYHEDMEIMNGQEMVEFDREPNETYKERAKEAIEGSTKMGNKTYTGDENGNTEPVWGASDAEFGKKLVDRANASSDKRHKATTPTTSMGDDIEIDTRKGERVKPKKIATEGMKRIKFKTPFNGVGNALKLIPESFRVDEKRFELTDGNESYEIKWVGSMNEGKAVVLKANSKDLMNEDFSKIKHLMGYNSKTTLGNLDGKERMNENNTLKAGMGYGFKNEEDDKECKCDNCDCVMTEEEYAKSHLCEVCSA